MRFVFSRRAERDLEDIWDYIAADSVRNANRMLERIEAAVHFIAEMPDLGSKHPLLIDPTLRVWQVKKILIVYRINTTPLQVARIISGYRNLADLQF